MEQFELANLAALNGYRFDLGMSPEEKKSYERRVKTGELVKGRLYWPWLTHGTRLKTCYVLAVPENVSEKV